MSKHIHRGSGTCGHNETLRPELRRTLHRLATAGPRTGVNMIFPGLVLFQPSPPLLLSTFLLSASLFSVGFRNSSLPEACSGKSKNSEFPGDRAGPHLKTCAHKALKEPRHLCYSLCAPCCSGTAPGAIWPIHDNTKTKVGKHTCAPRFFFRPRAPAILWLTLAALSLCRCSRTLPRRWGLDREDNVWSQ